ILTRMKYVAYFNNDIKLIIISATMDDDEPIYRRYYRNVNDNKMFPFNTFLQKYNLDRINIDRRIHISPPGATTQFEIKEYERPSSNAIDLVIEIINKTNDGDLLLFEPGRREISEAVEKINNK